MVIKKSLRNMILTTLFAAVAASCSGEATPTQSLDNTVATAIQQTHQYETLQAPTETNTPLPTNTFTPEPTATDIPPTETGTPSPDLEVMVNGSLVMRNGPGKKYDKVGQLENGEKLYAHGRYGDCDWLQVGHTRFEPEGWINSDSVNMDIACDKLLFGTFRPPTSILLNKTGSGYGQLEIMNKADYVDGLGDQVLKLTKNEELVMSLYIRAGGYLKVTNIPDGTYEIYFTTGDMWNSEMFTEWPSFGKFEDVLKYKAVSTSQGTRYNIYTIELNISGGNAPTTGINPDDFP